MDLFKAKLITILTAFGLLSGAGMAVLTYYMFPELYPNWYLAIMFYFLFFEVAIISFIVSGSQKSSSKKMVNLYMLTKVVKVITSLLFILVYVLVVKENIKSFVLLFMVFYFLYILIETFLFSKIERHLKEKNKEL